MGIKRIAALLLLLCYLTGTVAFATGPVQMGPENNAVTETPGTLAGNTPDTTENDGGQAVNPDGMNSNDLQEDVNQDEAGTDQGTVESPDAPNADAADGKTVDNSPSESDGQNAGQSAEHTGMDDPNQATEGNSVSSDQENGNESSGNGVSDETGETSEQTDTTTSSDDENGEPEKTAEGSDEQPEDKPADMNDAGEGAGQPGDDVATAGNEEKNEGNVPNLLLSKGNVDNNPEGNQPENGANSQEPVAKVADGTLIVETGDAQETGLRVDVDIDEDNSEVTVVTDDQEIETGEITDDQGKLEIDTIIVNAGDVNGSDYGIGINFFDYNEEERVETQVNAGDVKVEGEDGRTGVIVYNYNGDVDVNTGNIEADGGEGTAHGVEIQNEAGEVSISVEGDILAEGEDAAVGAEVLNEAGEVSISVEGDILAEGADEAYGADITNEAGQVNITVDGDVRAEGDSGAAFRIQGSNDTADPEKPAETTDKVSIVVDGTISGPDAAVQVVENEDGTLPDIELTVWSAKENENGEIVQLLKENDNGEPEQVLDENGEVSRETPSVIEKAISYIIRISEDIRDRLTVKGSGVVTIGEGEDGETYATAIENEDVQVEITLGEDEEVKTIYYNDDEKREAEVTEQNDSLWVKMLRGGAMLLGLDIEKKAKPEPEPEPVPEPEPEPAPEPVQQEDSYEKTPVVRQKVTYEEPEQVSTSTTVETNRVELVYVPVAEETEIHGITAAEMPVIQDVVASVSNDMDTDRVSVDVQDKVMVMDDEEVSTFDTLSIDDRLMLMLSAMELPDTDGAFRDTMSDQAKALAEKLDAQAAAMTVAEKAERNDTIDQNFQPRSLEIGGVTYESIGLVLVIERDGKKTFERYIFYHDGGKWILYNVEIGEYVVVE